VLEPATFAVSRGETLGLAGLLGSGRTETMKLIFGAIAGDSGSIAVSGLGTRDSRLRARSPRDAMRLGIGFCPEDRKDEAVFPGMSVAENMLVVIQAKRGWLRPLPKKKAAAIVDEHVAKLQIRTPDAQRPIENLSGGNQQKVVLSRWLAAQPSLLLLDEPTRGIDIGSKFEIRKLITDLAKGGVSFLFSSSELEEVVHTCDRVVVLRDRKMVGELHGADVNEQRVMEQIAKGEA
jgi:simple sugar transport system ATP-binding protein